MAKDKLTEYDATAANNTVVGDVNLAENSCLPSDLNNAVREVMSHLKEFAEGTNGINVLRLADDDASASIKFQAPNAVTTTVTFTLPDGDGESGQTLVTNGSGTLAWHAPYGNRNLIINGAMQVAQRGSVTGITSGSYGGPDRIKTQPSGLGTWTVEQSTDAPDGFSNSYKLTCTTADSSPAAGDYLQLRFITEGQNVQHLDYGSSGALSTTISFYVKSSKTGTFTYVLRSFDSGAGTRLFSKNVTISSANTWEYKTVTAPGDASGAINNDNTMGLDAAFWLNAGSSFSGGSERTTWANQNNVDKYLGTIDLGNATGETFQITGVQLEVGETATPFEHRSFGDEYNRCLRYTYVPRNDSVSAADGTTIANGECHSSSSGVYWADFPVPMRDIPTLAVTSTASAIEQAYHNGGVTTHNVTAMSYIATISGNLKGCFSVGSASFSGGEGAHCRYATGNIADNIIVFSAEL